MSQAGDAGDWALPRQSLIDSLRRSNAAFLIACLKAFNTSTQDKSR
ncbi:hypothetical protein CEV32_0768 [Brucella rhizosphaerae]|uniref:Uncharacterized protein n=1 Tax=Brucella rhizosphaerae TaxID=571254 RepID=A0A256FCJ5_9HYPH|nr:hypothetical protein CEV32_0768 [Brucella rhizosphaerae]